MNSRIHLTISLKRQSGWNADLRRNAKVRAATAVGPSCRWNAAVKGGSCSLEAAPWFRPGMNAQRAALRVCVEDVCIRQPLPITGDDRSQSIPACPKDRRRCCRVRGKRRARNAHAAEGLPDVAHTITRAVCARLTKPCPKMTLRRLSGFRVKRRSIALTRLVPWS